MDCLNVKGAKLLGIFSLKLQQKKNPFCHKSFVFRFLFYCVEEKFNSFENLLNCSGKRLSSVNSLNWKGIIEIVQRKIQIETYNCNKERIQCIQSKTVISLYHFVLTVFFPSFSLLFCIVFLSSMVCWRAHISIVNSIISVMFPTRTPRNLYRKRNRHCHFLNQRHIKYVSSHSSGGGGGDRDWVHYAMCANEVFVISLEIAAFLFDNGTNITMLLIHCLMWTTHTQIQR